MYRAHSRQDRAGCGVQARHYGGAAAEDALGKNPARHDQENRRRRFMADAGDHRRSGGTGRDRERVEGEGAGCVKAWTGNLWIQYMPQVPILPNEYDAPGFRRATSYSSFGSDVSSSRRRLRRSCLGGGTILDFIPYRAWHTLRDGSFCSPRRYPWRHGARELLRKLPPRPRLRMKAANPPIPRASPRRLRCPHRHRRRLSNLRRRNLRQRNLKRSKAPSRRIPRRPSTISAARSIWQESRFNAQAVSAKGAQGIAQFMPSTADYRGLVDPFDPIEALKNSASYLHDLKAQFGNLGLAAAAYNAGPGRVAAFVAGRRGLPSETRNYVAIITGWTADEWASPKPPETSETTIPQGVPCTRLANLILAPKAEAQRIAAYVPRWGMQLTANWSESRAWATYRAIQKQYATLIGDREPIVIRSHGIGLGFATRYNIRIGDDDRSFLQKFCNKLIAAGGACVVLRSDRG